MTSEEVNVTKNVSILDRINKHVPKGYEEWNLCTLIYSNLSFNTGIFPSSFNLARVMPISKKGDQQDCNNYRPISVLSNISKLIEKLLYNRLYKFLNQNKCLYNNQLGFQNHHSTNHALISITEEIQNALDDGKYACHVILYFKKAFNTLNHKIFLSKLEHCGIRGMPLKLF